MNGKVFLVGAGPGDPGLITRRGLELLQSADVLVYDRLVGAELIELARPDAEKIYVGKAAGQHSMTQDEINALIVEKAVSGRAVCRLKGGDPFVFGRGGEEALFCLAHGVPFEIVPGISSSIAAPAYAGIPVTHRELATSFAVVTGHTATDDAPPEALPVADTLVFLMGVRALPEIVRRLRERGAPAEKPVALVRWGTTTIQEVVTGTLETIEEDVRRAGLKPPALIVVGDVVNLREKLRWFDNRPLWGQTVVVTRAREQASGLVEDLRRLGARVVQCPTIRVQPLEEHSVLDEFIRQLPRCQWVVFTSTNGVEQFFARLDDLNLDARALGISKIAAIGPATVSALKARGLRPDLVPANSISEAVVEELLKAIGPGTQTTSVLIARAAEGREVLEQKLREAGVTVQVATCYHTVPDASNAPQVRELLEAGELNWVTFTSSSTVRNFLDALGREFVLEKRAAFKVAVIGPVTAATAREAGLEPDVIAENASVEALAEALYAAK